MSYSVGTRVFALRDSDSESINLFGFGVYEGDEIPPENDDRIFRIPNPRIVLDDGGVVWGFQCWWGEEEIFEKMRKGRTVVVVSLPSEPE